MISEFRDEHFAGVEALWEEAFPNDAPWNKASVAIPEKMRFQPGLMLVALEGPLVVGSVMAGYEGHRGWISRIAVLRAHRHKRIGQALLLEAEERLAALGCLKINLQVVASNAAVVRFYEGAGYQVEPRVSMSKRISQSRPAVGPKSASPDA
ncbi:MAG: GNAT family acetyltransferase [Candidatus Kaistia colombiensis]|nr:MAG: GNAT family acetyltransferase [Kaistia sp.]